MRLLDALKPVEGLTYRERIAHYLMRKGFSIFRCAHNYDRHWVAVCRAIKWYWVLIWHKDFGLSYAFERWTQSWHRCYDCKRMFCETVERSKQICNACWIRQGNMTPGIWFWNRRLLKTECMTLGDKLRLESKKGR